MKHEWEPHQTPKLCARRAQPLAPFKAGDLHGSSSLCCILAVFMLKVLEAILDDDADMADMYLARRAHMATTAAATTSQQRDEPHKTASTTGRSGAMRTSFL